MRRYEVTYVLAPTLSTEEVEQTITTYQAVAEEKGASVVKVDNWGKRRLAFPVKKHSEGYYVILTLDEERAEASAELERRFKVSDPVIRFLTVRIDEALQRAEKFKAKRELKKAKRSQSAAAKDEVASSAEASTDAAPTAEAPAEEPQAKAEPEQPTEEAPASEEAPETKAEADQSAAEDKPAEEAPAAKSETEDAKSSDAQGDEGKESSS